MIHPFLKNKFTLYLYISIWGFIAILHSLFLINILNADVFASFIDGLVSYSLLGILGFVLWYAIRYIINSKFSLFFILSHQIIVAFILLSFWNIIIILFLKIIFSNNPIHFAAVESSIYFRIISSLMLYIIVLLCYFLIIYYYNLQEKSKAELKLKETLKDAELNVLRSQINPHFLFNSLNSVTSLTLTNPQKAREMIVKLSDFLRYTVSNSGKTLSGLDEEIKNAGEYLEIEKIRFGDKLNYLIETEYCKKDFKIPSLLLQPLLENAIKHGVYESTEKIIIETLCKTINNQIEIIVRNNFDPETETNKGTGIGIKNIEERLRLIYHGNANFTINKNNNIFEAKIIIPLNI